MSLTREEADLIAEEACQQGWAEQANSEEAHEHGSGQVDMWENYGGAGWDRSQAADHHDWVDGACSRCHASRDDRTEDLKCPGVWINSQPTGTYHVELLFPGMYHSEKYWIRTTDEWRQLKAKVDELKEIVTQAVERGWYSGGFYRAPRKSGKLGMYIEVHVPGRGTVRVGGMRTWRKLCREADAIIDGSEVVTSKALTP